eukprot:CAMPEP_0172081688 /NCGR_PEP_ID=MMETSP1043-20130122/19448_1 /TAXON_ID=464988 /ORGANISM="Hemiselmis andersenii, Strain CCMP441" /LENGTH=38 /DNA_ID= /DNA_START= /DNA_END= /DNA_ORIENTATION=
MTCSPLPPDSLLASALQSNFKPPGAQISSLGHSQDSDP